MDIEAYIEQYKVNLGDMMLKRYRFYLDTKYWILMRDALFGKATPTQTKIYEKLSDLVKKEIAICPLSLHVFLELMKTGDEQKRLNTARVMDELSNQVCFISPLDILGQELLSFVRLSQARAEGKSFFNPAKYVFTKIAFVMGELYPIIEELPNQQINAIRLKFFNHLANLSLIEMLTIIKDKFPISNSEHLVAQLNKGKDNNQNWNSFHEVFMHEIAGLLDVAKDNIEKLCKYLYENDTGVFVTSEEIHKSDCVKLFSNSIYNAFAQKKINKELPFFHIYASLYAFVRYNKTQRYKNNDLIDFLHASWALPYCDGFFTEKPLHDWICGNLLSLDKTYGTKVLWKEDDILNSLQMIG